MRTGPLTTPCKQSAIQNKKERAGHAGNQFHTRWAARKCLDLLNPSSKLSAIGIEGVPDSKGSDKIDATLYFQGGEVDEIHYQFKHSLELAAQVESLSDILPTLDGFFDYYKESLSKGKTCRFVFYTNRTISPNVVKAIGELINEDPHPSKTAKDLLRHFNSGSSSQTFKSFLRLLKLQGDAENSEQQKRLIGIELLDILAEPPEASTVSHIIELVNEHMSTVSSPITLPDVLQRINETANPGDLFPAPPDYEPKSEWIKQQSFGEIIQSIRQSDAPVIIHAEGGAGKSVFLRQLNDIFGKTDTTIIYDCFGAGKYRNPIFPRHPHRIALVQINNELADKGLCPYLVTRSTDSFDSITRRFISNLQNAASLATKSRRHIFILIDAADNAMKMEDEDSKTRCFVRDIFALPLINNVHFILSSRTENLAALAAPDDKSLKIPLPLFSIDETKLLLNRKFKPVSDSQYDLVHKRTRGNPRILNYYTEQASSFSELIKNLVKQRDASSDEIIHHQLKQTLCKLRPLLSKHDNLNLDKFCQLFSVLPPNISLNFLSQVSGLTTSSITSFVSDMQPAFWISDDALRFRDEPTETFFVKNFAIATENLDELIAQTKQLSTIQPYAAHLLPRLLYRRGLKEELYNLASGDSCLPQATIAEERQVKTERLDYAVRIALQGKEYPQAFQLICRLEHVKSTLEAQDTLLANNLPLYNAIEDNERKTKDAWSHRFSSHWTGSENLCTAAILSSIASERSEAILHARRSEDWILTHISNYKKTTKNNKFSRYENEIQVDDLLPLVYTTWEVRGIKSTISYISTTWKGQGVKFTLYKYLIKTLLHFGTTEYLRAFETAIDKNAEAALALCTVTYHTFYAPSKATAQLALNAPDEELACAGADGMLDLLTLAIRLKLPIASTTKILKSLSSQVNFRSWCRTIDENRNYYRFVVLMARINKTFPLDYDKLIEREQSSHPTYIITKNDRDKKRFNDVIALYKAILQCELSPTSDSIKNLNSVHKSSDYPYDNYDCFYKEKNIAYLTALLRKRDLDRVEREDLPKIISAQDGASDLNLSHMLDLIGEDEDNKIQLISRELDKRIDAAQDHEPGFSLAECTIDIATRMLRLNKSDAACFYNKSLKSIANFGEDLQRRWEALHAIFTHASSSVRITQQQSFEYARCVDFVATNNASPQEIDIRAAFTSLINANPAAALAQFGRWTDRGLHDLPESLSSILCTLTRQNHVAPYMTWCFRSLINIRSQSRLLECCLANETSPKLRKQFITEFKSAVSKELLDDDFANQIAALENQFIKNIPQDIRQFNSSFHEDIKKIISETTYSDYDNTIQQFLSSEKDLYRIADFINSIPTSWWQKPSLKSHQQNIFQDLLRQIAHQPISYGHSHVIEACARFIGKSKSCRILLDHCAQEPSVHAHNYIALIVELSEGLLQSETEGALSKVLTDFTTTVPENFSGDGTWDDNLAVSITPQHALLTLLWTLLGSPFGNTRWRATHVVRDLLLSGSRDTIECLCTFLRTNVPKPFTCSRFPFYQKHAILHFLLALNNVATKQRKLIARHQTDIANTVLSTSNVLFLTYGKQILSALGSVSNTQTKMYLTRISKSLSSPFKYRDEQPLQRFYPPATSLKIPSNYHASFMVLPMDIDRYWAEWLARRFGIDPNSILYLLEQKLKQAATEGFNVDYHNDPRKDLFSRYASEDRTLPYKDEYPQNDAYCFYLIVHGLMEIAGQLLQTMPLVRDFGQENPFDTWVKYHTITFDDGSWIADSRGPIPLAFLKNEKIVDFEKLQVEQREVTKLLMASCDDPDSIPLFSSWTIWNSRQKLSCHTKAFIIPNTKAKKLALQLNCKNNPHQFIPYFFSDKYELDDISPRQTVRGLFDELHKPESQGRDSADPFANGLKTIDIQLAPKLQTEMPKSTCTANVWTSAEILSPNDHSVTCSGEVFYVKKSTLLKHLRKHKSKLIIQLTAYDSTDRDRSYDDPRSHFVKYLVF